MTSDSRIPNVLGAPRMLLEGLNFPEAPRWHNESLWFSDMRARRVLRMSPAGVANLVIELQDLAGGLGFLADGSLLVVSMNDRLLLRHQAGGGTKVHSNVSLVGGWEPGDFLNDLVVDEQGGAYVGTRTRGLNPRNPGLPRDRLIYVNPNGDASVVAESLLATNGIVLLGSQLVIAETYAHRLTVFDRSSDGSLTNRRTLGDIGGSFPDGMCTDIEGGIWFGSPYTNEFIRVDVSGAVTDRLVPTDGVAVACALGGPGGLTLFMCCADGAILSQVNPIGLSSGVMTTTGNIQAVNVRIPASCITFQDVAVRAP